MNRIVYLIVGGILAVIGVLFLVWFARDIAYAFSHPDSYTSMVRMLGTVATLVLAGLYLWIGVMRTSNRVSDWSLWILFGTAALSIGLSLLECNTIGGTCPAYSGVASVMIRSVVLPLGILASVVLATVSRFL